MDGGDEISIARLTAAMAAGDERAFRRFHGLYWHRIYAWHLVATRGDEALSEELTQKTMIKVARNIRPISTAPELWAWLGVIARNVFLDACRSRSRRPAFIEWNEATESPPDSADQADRELIDLLRECIGELAPGDRTLVEQIYLDGESREETASKLNLSYKGLDSRLVRLRAHLRRLMLGKLRHDKR